MPCSKYQVISAIFDIKPVDDSGRVDLQKIYRVKQVVNLAKLAQKIKNPAFGEIFVEAQSSSIRPGLAPDYSIAKTKRPAKASPLVGTNLVRGLGLPSVDLNYTPSYQEKLISQGELERYINADLDVKKEIKNIGGKVTAKKVGKPRYRPIFAWQKSGLTTSTEILRAATEFLGPAERGQDKDTTPKMRALETSPRQVGVINDFASPTDLRSQRVVDDYQTILSQINQRVLPRADELFVGEPRKIDPISLGILSDTKPVAASPEIESWATYAKSQITSHKSQINSKFKISKRLLQTHEFISNIQIRTFVPIHKFVVAVAIVGFSALIFTLLGQYGIDIKNEIVKESNSAVASLEQANESLKVFDFTAASDNFAQAYGEFSKAGDNLNFMGAGIISIFAELPGGGSLKSAKNLVEAGKLLAEAGGSVSEAVNYLSGTVAILNIEDAPLRGSLVSNLRKSLLSSSRNLSKARALLSDVSPDILPEDKKEAFADFQSKLPQFQALISDAVDYAGFLEGLTGSNGVKKYLVLFQNSSELRPTGGFPGTYAVVTFKDGKLLGFAVDDVYNLDGQLKENIIPPLPLQHITPTWGMRDSNWFIDFSISAQKAMEFFNKEAGYEVDGVITMSPKTISEILKIVGSIEMPEYDIVVNGENFASTVQEEVEYGENRQQPKKIIMDMAPRLLEKIYSSSQSQWLDIFNVFISGLSDKDILMYFRDLSLENFVAEKGFGGLVKKTDGDYLMVTLSNVKGSKTDKVVDNSVKITTRFENERAVHKLELTRRHNGGATRYGFYNKQSPTYVRVLVPDGAELISVSGNSSPDFKPLISYDGESFKRDEDLFKLESSFHFDGESGVSRYRESGKTGFAFWIVTDPGEEKTVELKYSVPFNGSDSGGDYNMYIQKQPGLEVDNFEFRAGDAYIYNGEFDKDLELRFKLK